MSGSRPTVAPLVMAAVRNAGAAGISCEGIAATIPGANLMSVRHMLRKMIKAGEVFVAKDSYFNLHFASKADASTHAEREASRKLEVRRAVARAYWAANYVPTPRAPRSRKPRPQSSTSRPSTWTPEQIEQLRTLYPITRDTSALATELGRTKKALVMKAHKLGITKRVQKKKAAPPKPKVYALVYETPKTARVKPAPAIDTLVVRASARGPAYLPGPLVITDKTRHVVYPSKSAPLRTNTFSQF